MKDSLSDEFGPPQRPPRPGQPWDIDAPFSVGFVHRLRFTRGVFDHGNGLLDDILLAGSSSPVRLVVFVDEGVAKAHPGLVADVTTYFKRRASRLELAREPHVIRGGEDAKNDSDLRDAVMRIIHDTGLCRQSYVLVIGGGAVCDLVGYCAAIAHRGVRLVRVPTTTLAQADAAIGVKNGVNAFDKKNYLGTFSPPWAVINDEAFLQTLSDRDWRCGFAEAVKVALVKDRSLFEQIAGAADAVRSRNIQPAMEIIRRSARLHLDHIVHGGDPFELTSARPLDFGHWSAHKLEQLSNYAIRHGEAVAIGVMLDSCYSVLMGMLDSGSLDAIESTLHKLGLPLYDELLEDTPAMLSGLEEFREHLGGPLTITLLAGIGRGVDVHEIDHVRMCDAVSELRRLAKSKARRVS